MNRKGLALLLITVMMAATGCSSAKDARTEEPETISQDETSAESSSTETSEDSADDSDTIDTDSTKMFSSRAQIEETVLFDEKDIKITATELNYDNYNPKLMVTIENNTDKELEFISGSIGYGYNSVNGYMISGAYLNSTVAAGKKALESMVIHTDSLALCGITDIANIEVAFMVQDDDYNEVLETGPIKIETSIADTYDATADPYVDIMNQAVGKTIGSYKISQFEENTIYDQNGVQIVSEGLLEGAASGDQILRLEANNTTEAPVILRVSDVSFNGLLVCDDNWTSKTINAGCKGFIELEISDMVDYYFLEPFDLSSVAQVDFILTPLDTNYKQTGSEQSIELALSDEDASFDTSGEELYNSNGVRVVYKGVYDESGSARTYKHAILMIENTSSGTIWADAGYNNLSVNGYMADYIAYSTILAAGQTGIMDVRITNRELEKLGINDISDITEIELKLELKDLNYSTIDTPILKMIESPFELDGTGK